MKLWAREILSSWFYSYSFWSLRSNSFLRMAYTSSSCLILLLSRDYLILEYFWKMRSIYLAMLFLSSLAALKSSSSFSLTLLLFYFDSFIFLKYMLYSLTILSLRQLRSFSLSLIFSITNQLNTSQLSDKGVSVVLGWMVY